MKQKILSIILLFATLLSTFSFASAASKEPFSDVSSNHWFSTYVIYVYENKLMNGMSDTKFDPNGTCTRAMAATVLYRIAGEPTVNGTASFNDLTASWYKKAVAWAEDNGVVNGVGNGKFAPNGLVTREQLLTMIWRFAGEPAPSNANSLNTFSDAKKVSSYAKSAFNWGIENGIINGKDGKLVPSGNATRAEFAKIITVFDKSEVTCDHNWNSGEVTSAPTCTESGTKTFICSECGRTKTETIAPLEHDYVDGICSHCGAGNYVTDAFCTFEDEYCWHIPKINLSGSGIEALNQEIYNKLYENYTKYVVNSSHTAICYTNYSWTVSNRILSIVITEFWDYSYTSYYVYNISIDHCVLLSKEELIASYDLSMENYTELARAKMKARFEEKYKEMLTNNPSMSSQYNAQLDETISDSNVTKAMPYIDINGDLCIVARIYSLAGADSYDETLKLKGSGSPSPITCTVDHAAQEEEPEATEAWKQRYLSYIEDNNLLERYEYAYFALVCIDNNNIPEIIINYGKLLWISNDTVMEEDIPSSGSGCVYYLEKQNKFRIYQTSACYYYDYIYELKNGKLEQLHEGIITMRERYDWDHEDVSSEEYEALLDAAFDTDKAEDCDFSSMYKLTDAIINW